MLYLDKPIWWGYVEDMDSVTVVKTNRNLLITGAIGASNGFNDWRWPNITISDGVAVGRIYLFKNCRFQYVGSCRYSGSSSFNRGIIVCNDNYWSSILFDGISYMMGSDGST